MKDYLASKENMKSKKYDKILYWEINGEKKIKNNEAFKYYNLHWYDTQTYYIKWGGVIK